MNQSLSHIDSGVTSLSALRGNHEIHLYYPAEGFGAIYRRVMMNDFFANLIRCTNIQTVAEVPVDSYGVAGAGSLVFAELGCEVTLISEDRTVLDRAQDLMEFNGVSNVRYLQSTFKSIPVPPDTFDFTWSFDRVQALPDPNAFLQELARVSKAAMVAVPNVHNYGQYAHAIYHRLTGTACEFVGPREWMLRRPIREALEAGGMTIIDDDVIDAPWWPGFPELPNLVRKMLGKPLVAAEGETIDATNLEVVPLVEVPQVRKKAERAAFIERSRFVPGLVKLLFAHNAYVLACKPRYRRELGL